LGIAEGGDFLALKFNRITAVGFSINVSLVALLPPFWQYRVSGLWFSHHCFSCSILFRVSANSSGLFVPISSFFLFLNSSCKPLLPETLNAVPFPKSPSRKPQPPYSVRGEYHLTNVFVKLSQV